MECRQLIITSSFEDFYVSLDEKAQNKIDYSLQIIAQEHRPPNKFFRHIRKSDGFFEVRATLSGKQYRVIAYFEKEEWEGDLILLGGFLKTNNKKGYLKPYLKKAKKAKLVYEKAVLAKASKNENTTSSDEIDKEDKSAS